MSDNVQQLPVTERCGLCGDDPASIYAELDMVIAYRDDKDNRYRAKLKVCIGCSDFLTLSRERADTEPPPPPSPIRNGMAAQMCGCGQPAVVMSAEGLKCARCAF